MPRKKADNQLDDSIVEQISIPEASPLRNASAASLMQSSELLDLLGRWTDASLAVKFGVSATTIRAIRLKLRIPAAKRLSQQRVHWTQAMDDLIGTKPDADLAMDLKISVATVYQRRILLKVPSFWQRNSIPSSKRGSLESEIWTSQILTNLGKVTDAELARQLGIDATKVRQKRVELGIAVTKRLSHRRIHWTPEMDAMLGTDIDLSIARKLGISDASVSIRRRSLKIASWKDSNST